MRLGAITRHGSGELRRGLGLGAQAVIITALKGPHRDDPLLRFARRLVATGKPRNLVAVANKLARIVLAMLKSGQPDAPHHSPARG